MSKKVNITVEEMIGAVKANADKPWEVLGVGRSTWFRSLAKIGKTMEELTKSQSQSQSQSQLIGTSTSAPEETPVVHINPLPQWQPSNNNNAGPGGVRFRYTDPEKYESFRKEDALRVMEQHNNQQGTIYFFSLQVISIYYRYTFSEITCKKKKYIEGCLVC